MLNYTILVLISFAYAMTASASEYQNRANVEIERAGEVNGHITHKNSVQLEESCSLSEISFPDTNVLDKPGSVINDRVGRYNGFYSFGVTSSKTKYDILGKKQLLKAKYEFEIINKLRGKDGSDHFWDGAYNVGHGMYEGFLSLFSGPDQSCQNIYSAAGKLTLKLSDTDGLNDIFSDSPVKRELAAKLGFDAYSYNPEVHTFLNDAAENYSNGMLFGKTLALLVPLSPVSVAISLGSINADSEGFLNNKSPEEVVRYAREKLITMGCKEQLVKRLLENQYLNPRTLLYFTDFIWKLRNVNGGGYVSLQYIISADSRIDVETIYYQLERYSRLHETRTIAELFPCGHLMGVRLKDDMVPLVIIPYDYLEFNQHNEAMVAALLKKTSSDCELWCSGAIDQKMNDVLNKLKLNVILTPPF